MLKKLFLSDPYRILFLSGAIFSIAGSGLWILFSLNLIENYPLKAHMQIMVLGFLYSYVAGFLMTAVPRMTATNAATLNEKYTAVILVWTFFITSLLGFDKINNVCSIFLFLFLIVFIFRRRLKMKSKSLAPGFVFIPAGLMCGLVGSMLLCFERDLFPGSLKLGKLMLNEGFVLNLIIGLGSRLIPMLSKKIGAISPLDVKDVDKKLILFQGFLFNGSFFVEVYLDQQLAYFIRLIVLISVSIWNFKLLKPMYESSKQGIGLILVGLIIPTAYLLLLIFPQHRVHLIHLLYIGGFSLVTYLISVRVSLAHGGGPLSLEKTSTDLACFIIFFLLSMVMRVSIPILPDINLFYVFAAAAAVYILAVFMWVKLLIKYLWINDSTTPASSSC